MKSLIILIQKKAKKRRKKGENSIEKYLELMADVRISRKEHSN